MCYTILTSVCFAKAEPLLGYDVLAVARYCNTFLKAPPLPAMSTLMVTFGNPIDCINRRIAQGGLRVLQIDLLDATCHRRRLCERKIKPLPNIRQIRHLSAQIRRIAIANPNLEVYISPYLEHDILNRGVLKRAFNAAQAKCPECQLVQSRWRGKRLAGVLEEKHGNRGKGEFVSLDGQNMFFDGVVDKTRAKIAFFLWWHELNLNKYSEEWTYPSRRKHRPTVGQFRQAVRKATR